MKSAVPNSKPRDGEALFTYAIFDVCAPTKINKPQFALDIHSQTLFKSVQALLDKICI
jgi:hypothetical protein